ncbi:UPF0182 family protein [Alkalibacter rhizosphaerae]|uniref:UPF0182 protein J0B03_06000 n=1 Tax=Alkalibacter rhizosphaerae TaxID=2815577 RepID=A0A975AIL2_9FIRM|nr:UPF0182 family protein [Alkalibacter rhizosphaerae]QSX09607.1 UPF0182 family protein [Alkalibacter rhizosphaerae]
MQSNKSKKLLTIIIAAVAILGALFALFSNFYIDYLWFKETGYTQVFFKEIVTKLQLGVPMFLISTILLYFYFRFIKKYVNKSSIVVIREKKKDFISLGAGAVVGLVLTVIATNALWYRILEYVNAEPFGVLDPIFNKDVSFYVFQLPFLESLFNVLSLVVFVIFVATLVYTAMFFWFKKSPQVEVEVGVDHRVQELKDFLMSFGNIMVKQVGIFVALFFILTAYSYYLRRFGLLFSVSEISYGAGYTDSTVRLPVYTAMIFLSLASAAASIFFGFRKKLKWIAIAPVVMIAVSFLGGAAGLVVENYVVGPNQFGREEAYLERHIDFTTKAYGLENVVTKEFSAKQNITLEDLEENERTISNIPINDYRPTLDVYNSIQAFRIYYQFHDVDIDRYELDGDYTQVFISAREMDNQQLEENARTWINQHLKYTHGFGVAMSPVNRINEVGQPDLAIKDIPPMSNNNITIEEPRIYFGELTDTYAITNAKTPEFDYPEGSNNKENFYTGNAGIPLNFFNRLAFTINLGETKILLSSEITGESKMLIRRNIIERLQTIAPFLAYDEDPYVVASEGKLYWIVDAFTLSDRYPYAKPFGEEGTFNYVRNSVKVVIDAYNGDVTFYQVEPDDPLATVYENIYKDILVPIDQMPADLRSHVRYSQEMFDIQADMYRTYHMTNARVFYNKEDQWELPRQIYGAEKQIEMVESTYLIMKLPEREEEFTLMVPFTARQRDNMVAWMAAMNDGDSYGDIMVYTFPKQTLVYGPMQIEQRVDQDTVISPQLTLLGQQGSEVIRGNMMAIPIEEAILYIEPVYIRARDSDRSLPEVKKIIVSYNNRIIMADSLQDGLNQIFGISDPDDDEGDGDDEQPGVVIPGDLNSLILEANTLFDQAQEAQQNGDWAEYGRLIQELEDVLSQLQTLQLGVPETPLPETIEESVNEEVVEE